MRRIGWQPVVALVGVAVATATSPVAAPAQSDGPAIYRAKCATCHDGDGSARAPRIASLSSMSTRAIHHALTAGSMRQVVELSEADRVTVAEYLGRRKLAAASIAEGTRCRQGATPPPPSGRDWTAWGGSPSGTGGRTAEQAGLTAAELPRLVLKWAFGFPDGTVTRSQPSVVGDQVVVGGQFGEVLSLDAKSGCVQWHHEGSAAIKGVVAISPPRSDGRRVAVAADFRTVVVALDLETGALRWRTTVGTHPASNITGSPVVHGGVVIVPISSMEVAAAQSPAYHCCTSSGEVVALDLETGAVRWRHRIIADSARQIGTTRAGTPIFGPAGAPVWSSPTVDPDRNLVYVGTGEHYTSAAVPHSDALLALDLATGAVRWAFQATADDAFNMACGVTKGVNCPTPHGPDVDFGQAPALVSLPNGRQLLIAGQKLGVVYALDPDRLGAVVWQRRVGRGGALGGVHWGVGVGEGMVFAPISDRITGIDPAGDAAPGLHTLDLATGEHRWSAPAPGCPPRPRCFSAYSAAPVVIPGAVLVGGLDGIVRGYSAGDGQLLWQFDTVGDFTTVNGVAARGGAIDGPSPTVANGMVFVSSGYGLFGQMPGNVLLAFGVQ
ncbi:MAG: dehydrogenase [Gemmatimonadetes bacterium]|nr:dehydrogenase [Gemmatimonadota bacterium]